MIKISDKLWYVIKPDDNDSLAYMCPYAESKEGEPLSNVVKMQSTGRGWAGVSSKNVYKIKDNPNGNYDYLRDDKGRPIVDYVEPAKGGQEFIVDNKPISGFYVGSSVSRWSTSNKLFRVKDPRGFTVEIPTDNLATLLHHTTVVKGFVENECVWGREGNNHILLPVNSEPYLITLDQMNTLENKLISLKDLKVGDCVKLFEDDSEYYYAGKIKGVWQIRGYTRASSYYWEKQPETQYSDWLEVVDDKWTDAFLRNNKYSTKQDQYSVDTFSKPKIVEIIRHKSLELTVDDYSWYCPTRVQNKTGLADRYGYRLECKLVSVIHKDSK